ncbi:MAG TPA: DUF2336 domain-containing protein [Candidatus Sulfotelmatobacter sp.]|nr:DUF2336 domain-containing protein [Candidatus Sulfotelmatobacter sp.]
MSSTLNLTSSDVARLLQDPSASSRLRTAEKVAHAYRATGLSPSEREIANDIFRVMMRDAAARVRQSLAENLKHCPDVPRDVALVLANDVIEVAAPFLQSSTVLTEDDLIQIVTSQSPDHLLAVARRERLGAPVADALVERGTEAAVAALMENQTAAVSEQALQRALDRFGDSERVHGPMVYRSKLPITVAERLVTLVSNLLCERLLTHHDLPPSVAADLVLQSRERAVMSLSAGAGRTDVASLVAQLHENGRLTPTIVLRALCTGDLDFFENAMAALGGIPVANAYRLIHDGGQLGFQALYQRCNMPAGLYPIARAAIDAARELEYDGRPGDRERFVARTIERVLTRFEEGFQGENADYLIEKLTRLAA